MNFEFHQNLPQYPTSQNLNWGFGNTVWTPAENKLFENALALHDKDTPDRWFKVAEMIPGKTVDDVRKQYSELEFAIGQIEAGVTPLPGYVNSTCIVDWENDIFGVDNAKRTVSTTQERRKGIPWTQAEHMLFLKGLQLYGKGDWRDISRKVVKTRTPTQVASHAQKYFIRQESGAKDKRRSSIHDITIVNLAGSQSPLTDIVEPQQPDQRQFSAIQPQEQYQQPYLDDISRSHVDGNWQNQGSMMAYHIKNENFHGYQQIGLYDATLQMQHPSSDNL